MATNSKKPEEKKASAVEPVEEKAASKATESKTVKKTAKKAAAAPKETKAAVKNTASTGKKSAVAVKKTTTARKETPAPKKSSTVQVKKSEPQEDATILEEAREALKSGSVDKGALILGAGLLFMGFLLLVTRLLGIPFGTFTWPFIFIVPGVLIFLIALTRESRSSEGVAVLGGILTSLGFVFLFQSITNLWASWAYIWALIAPGSIGFSQMIYGMRKERDEIVQTGRRLASIGLTIFAVGFVFFEVILGISGFGLRPLGIPTFPMLLILAGVLVLIGSFAKNRR